MTETPESGLVFNRAATKVFDVTPFKFLPLLSFVAVVASLSILRQQRKL